MSTETPDIEPSEEATPVVFASEVELPALTTEPVHEVRPQNPTVITAPLSGYDWDFAPPVAEVQLLIQQNLAYRDLYGGRKNGIWGNLSVFAIQEYFGRKSTAPDAELCELIQEYAEKLGVHIATPYVLTPEVWEAFANGLDRKNNH